MKSAILMIVFALVLNAELVDLGKRGNTYEIKEKSFMELLREKFDGVDLITLEKDLKKEHESSLIKTSNIENCKKNSTRIYEPSMIIEEDIVIPYYNKIVYKKGYKYNTLKENNISFNKYLIFIDADSDIQLALARKYSKFADVYAVKGNLLNMKEKGLKMQYAREKFEVDAFKINCLPSIYAQDGYKFNVSEYALENNHEE